MSDLDITIRSDRVVLAATGDWWAVHEAASDPGHIAAYTFWATT